MRAALVNPGWDFEGSIYFGCREPHLPIEFGYARALLERSGHEALIIDCRLEGLSSGELLKKIALFKPHIIVIPTAPTYLFWRCPPPELRVPLAMLDLLRDSGSILIVVGPHGSSTPHSTLKKTGADYLIRGEFEGVLPALAEMPRNSWTDLACVYRQGEPKKTGLPHETDLGCLPAIKWPDPYVLNHSHNHHRFHDSPDAPGAEIESSRGCPFSCSFCARENFRGAYRRRRLAVFLKELDYLIAQGARYFYFIDEIFFPHPEVIRALAARKISFGIQTRIDLWSERDMAALGRAGCVSIEAGVESITEEGRSRFNKKSAVNSAALENLLCEAKQHVPFVQATLLGCPLDRAAEVAEWRERLIGRGVWANEPVPLFPYPGSAEYRRLWGEPDDSAWERAHSHYLEENSVFSDIQDSKPFSLPDLERRGADAH
ncbi:MAG: TIGR04295 family B12-binding domain-containing radical SAM protein [Syntrophaceae bacterium]